jgi:protein TonB
MASMSGVALPSAPRGPRSEPDGRPALEDQLFTGLVVSDPRARRSGLGNAASALVHALIAALVILVPIFWPTPSPEHPDYIRLLFYNPPPPPPPPLPRGSAIVAKVEPAKPVTPDQRPQTPKLTVEIPKEAELRPEARSPESEQAGSPTGSDSGMEGGLEIGVEGGVLGGVPGGVLGGVVGGTGDSPVLDYDQPPRLLKQTKPQYPQEAFIKKIEGTVVLEILIDASGRVAQARVIHSIPALDEAARQTALQWLFAPAVKHGRPVATIAQAPVTFRIY